MHSQYRGTMEDGILFNSSSPQNNENQTEEEDCEVGREEEAQDSPSRTTMQQPECQNHEQESYLEL